MKILRSLLAAVLLGNLASAMAADAPALYTQHCASCHGATRFGGMGPALLPESLERLKRKDAVATIRDGQASALIVADLYRLSRPSTEFARIIEALDEADVPLYVVGQGRVSLPATPELGIMLAIAEYEAKHSEEDFTL